MSERFLPALMRQLHELDFDYADGEGYDFEPYPEFLSDSETRDWIRAWTGNAEVDGAAFRVFGQDGTGGYAAFWLVRPGAPLVEQPIVFLGSEGERGVVARNLADYLWVLAGGFGPFEAIAEREPAAEGLSAQFRRFAEQHAPDAKRGPTEIVLEAQREFPNFSRYIDDMCR
jgi:hypothetical protein